MIALHEIIISSQQRQKRKRFSHQKKSWDSCTASASSFLTIECANFLLARLFCQPSRNLLLSLRRIFIKFNSFLHIVIPRKQFLLITESVSRDRLGRVAIGWRGRVNVTSTTGFHYVSHIQGGVPRREKDARSHKQSFGKASRHPQ